MRYSDIINEKMLGDVALVYHSSAFGPEIIESGGFEGKTTCRINDRSYQGVSFTRSYYFARQYDRVIFGMDFQALKQKFRIIPFADNRISVMDDLPGDHRRESEEFAVSDFVPLAPYCKAIWLSSDYRTDDEYFIVQKHPLFKGFYREP